MPLVTSYSEEELADFMKDVIGTELAALLGWTDTTGAPDSYQRPVNTALRLYGLSGSQVIADATDAGKLEAAARLAVWEAAADATASWVNVRMPDGMGSDDATAFEHIGVQLKRAKLAAMRLGVQYTVGRMAIVHVADPYTAMPDDERVYP